MSENRSDDAQTAAQLLDRMSEGYVELDADWCVVTLNPAASKLLGCTAETAVGKPLEELLTGVDDLAAKRAPRDDGDGPIRFDAASSGGPLTVRVYRDSTGDQAFITRSDERGRAADQLRILNQIMRHDVRNDMNVVLGWADILEDHVDEDGADFLDRITRASHHAVDLTVTMRDFIAALGSAESPELEPVALGPVLEGEIETRRATHPNAEIRLVGDVPEVNVVANDLLTSVFRNVLNNAVQHNDSDVPMVTIDVSAEDESVRVRIADNGPGIPAERAADLFGRTRDEPGSDGGGVGLYLVDRLVTQFGGTIRYEDNEPRGSVFIIELQRPEGAEHDGD
jgi:signal transduction histidine kinase